MTQALSFIHRFEPGAGPERPLLLLHGTGGDENDLVPLGQTISPRSALLSPRGKVLEGGAPRFFRRTAEGVLDEDDVRRRAAELAEFIADARKVYGLAAPVAVGYSNGANIAAALLLLQPETLAGAVLLRAMSPLREPPEVDLSGKPVLLLTGRTDAVIPAARVALLAATLASAGAALQHETLPTGHQLTPTDVKLAKAWLANL